jgi:hypothetical protein
LLLSRLFAASGLFFILVGCAIHPLPEDVSGVKTYYIVRQIRCETREAIKEQVLREVTRLATASSDPIAIRLLNQYNLDPDAIWTFDPKVFSGTDYVQVRNYFNLIYSAGIAYNFDLTMSEQNNIGTVFDLLGPWAPKFTLGVSADFNRQRSNERTFTVTDTFGKLMTGFYPVRGHAYCDGFIAQDNYVYPITGHIGINKTVFDFFEVSIFGSLSTTNSQPSSTTGNSTSDSKSGGTAGSSKASTSASSSKSGTSSGGASPFVDQLTFTTTIDGSLTPKVVFSPKGSGFQFADASITGTVSRTDTHKVTVGIALPSGAATILGSLRTYVFSRQRSREAPVVAGSAGGIFYGNAIIARPSNDAEALAAEAVDQIKSREVTIVPTQ